jgi:hypothetical protein
MLRSPIVRVVVALAAAAAVIACGSALAFFTTTGAGLGAVGLNSLGKPTITAATPAAGGSVSLTWSAVTPPSPSGVLYYVTRDGEPAAGTCSPPSNPSSSTSCVDRGVEPGTHSYVVTAKWRSWTASSSPAAANVTEGAATRFALSATTTAPVAGASDNLTITAQDSAGHTATTYIGAHNLIFSGASASPGGTVPTVSNSSGTAVAFGSTTAISFNNGVAAVSGAENGVMRLYRAAAANISVTDGTLATASPLAVTVAPEALSKLVLAVESTTPALGGADNLTIGAQDTYGNTVPGYAGTKSLTFSGASASGGGNLPTVTNATGSAIAFGTSTPIAFTAGVATASGSLNGQMRLYKPGAASITVTDGSLTSAGVTVTPAVAAATKFSLAASTLTPTAGGSVNLTTTALDTYGNTVTTYTGSHNLVFSGASASPGGNLPTVTNAAGEAIAFGTATPIAFSSGVASVSTTKNGVMALYRAGSASISVSEGAITAAAPLAITVSPAAMSKLALGVESTTPAVGAADRVTTTAQDAYGNTVTTYTGSHNLVFSGASASPGGTLPTVTNATGSAIAFGTSTPIAFTAGVATASGSLNGEMRLYKAGAASIAVTDGTFSSATVTVTPVAAAATKLGLAASTLTPTAGGTVNLTLTALDTYGNTATAYTGAHNVTFSGASTSAGGNAPTVANAEGTSVPLGTATSLTFTAGVASVASAKNGVLTLYKAETANLAATDGTISAPAVAIVVSAATASKLALTHVAASAGTLSTPCYFTCTITKLGSLGTVKAAIAVADTYGNIVSALGTGHTVTVTTNSGTINGGSLTIASTGAAESTTEFLFTAPSNGNYTASLKAATAAGTVYANATATATK